MSDVDTTTTEATSPAGDNGAEVDPSAAISRGKGLSLEAVKEGSPAAQAVAEFKDLVARHKAAEEAAEALKGERNAALRALKDDHNVGFSAIAEIIEGTSSLALYLYERAAGKTAKQIREESQASRKAKEALRESDPDRKPARKQTPEERAFRKQQREALKAFLAEQRAAAEARGEDVSGYDAQLQGAEADQAADDAED